MKKHLTLTFLVILVYVFSACTASQESPPSPVPVPTNSPLPDFLGHVVPWGAMSLEHYIELFDITLGGGGIQVEVWMQRDAWASIPLQDIRLYLDGELVSNEILMVGDGLMPHGPFYLGWAVPLELGLHEATFQIVTASCETLEYTWQFVLVEGLVTPMP